MATLISLLLRISLLLVCFSAYAADNSIKMGYNFVTVSQNVVFNSAMQSGGALSFTAQVADGGGRNPGDPFTMKLVFYNSSNQIVNTVQQSWTLVLGAAASTYTLNATNCGSSCSNVAYVSVQFYGKDGGYWAGNYGPFIQSPSLTFNGGGNILYNPQFGIYTGTAAQGWASSNGWQSCALYSGTNTCVTNNGASVNGGTYDVNGGTTAGTAGGYSAAPPAPTYSSGITSAQSTRKASETAQRTSQSGNAIYIDQTGDSNTFTIRQKSVSGGRARIELNSYGNYNTYNLNQGYDVNGNVQGIDDANHYLSITVNGNTNSITTQQSGYTHWNEITVTGNSNNITNLQTGTGNKILFEKVNGANNTITTNQKDSGNNYLDIDLTGNGHSVNVTQQGAGNHAATIQFTNSGGASNLNLNQSGSSAQTYSIQQSCTNAAGCGTTITQP